MKRIIEGAETVCVIECVCNINQEYPVAGVVTAPNNLAIVAPYLVLAGIVAVASAIYIKRRKH